LAERERLVRPFQRGDAPAAQPTGRFHPAGHGLGLAIVAQLAAWHRGASSIDASPSLGDARLGVTFQFSSCELSI